MENSNEKNQSMRRVQKSCIRIYIISGIFFAILLAQILYIIRCSVTTLNPIFIGIFIPLFISFLLIFQFKKSSYEKYLNHKVLFIVLLVVSTLWMLYSWCMFYVSNAFVPIKDIEQYEKAFHMHKYIEYENIYYFPRKITHDMQNPRLFSQLFINSFLLAYETTPENLETLKEKFYPSVKCSGTTDLKFIEEINSGRAYCRFPYLGSTPECKEPDDLNIWVFDYKINCHNREESGIPISSGYIYGVAFSDERCEIEYFYDSWIE